MARSRKSKYNKWTFYPDDMNPDSLYFCIMIDKCGGEWDKVRDEIQRWRRNYKYVERLKPIAKPKRWDMIVKISLENLKIFRENNKNEN